MEGVAGVVCGGYGYPRTSEEEATSRRLMTREVNAAVQGILDAAPGADVHVWEAHPLVLEELHPEARIIRGLNWLETAGLGFEAALFVGQHAMAGLQKAVLPHTGSSRSIMHIWVNGREFGEAALYGALLGESGTPVIFLSGDSAATAEAREFFGDIVTVTTMEAHGNRAAICLSNPKSCKAIRAGAAEAVRRSAGRKPFRIAGPVEFRIRYRFAEIADRHCLIPGVRRVDATTVACEADTYPLAFRLGYLGASLVLAAYDR